MYFKQMLKVSTFYLEKKSFMPKKIYFRLQSLNMPREIQKMAFAVLIFSEGFEHNQKNLDSIDLADIFQIPHKVA